MQLQDSTIQELNASPERPGKHPLSFQQRILLVLIIATLAIGSIFYLYNDRNGKISQYAYNKQIMGLSQKSSSGRDYVLNMHPYVCRVKQRFTIYSTITVVMALGLSLVILRPRKCNE
ncbi:MAG: hypothetical protein Q8J68_02780 [Methanolobus sp.]|uniref:hypothetical protein n=1 Tax=Methanolobus sp. TaxID=1874737 RepID=UPI00272F02E7|nr:hypothetical protein [Methanolobus sp.]MDP2216197.1 hypothetical protein [Methanolobus sp.]